MKFSNALFVALLAFCGSAFARAEEKASQRNLRGAAGGGFFEKPGRDQLGDVPQFPNGGFDNKPGRDQLGDVPHFPNEGFLDKPGRDQIDLHGGCQLEAQDDEWRDKEAGATHTWSQWYQSNPPQYPPVPLIGRPVQPGFPAHWFSN